MQRVKRVLQAIYWILRKPKNLYFILENEDQYHKKVRKEFNISEFGLPSISISDLDIPFPQQLPFYSFLGGTVQPTDLILLRGLAKRYKRCKYFEIGTFRGESAMNLADMNCEVYTLDLTPEELKQKKYPKEHLEAQYSMIDELKNITLLKGSSLSFDFDALKRKFDLIFIDGDHHWKYVKNDTEKIFQYLVHRDSIIVWHDYMKNYSTIWWEVLYGILKGLKNDLFQNIYHVRNTNCLVYLPFHIHSKIDTNTFVPTTNYSLTVKIPEN